MKQFDLLVFIDDDEATNFYNKYIVKKAEVCKENLFFQKAEDALVFFGQLTDEDTIPDAIFLDINMPKVDGWEFLKRYSRIKLKKSPVIIMLTTSLNAYDRQQAEGNPYIHKFLHKPLTKDFLYELKKEMLGNGGNLTIAKSADEEE